MKLNNRLHKWNVAVLLSSPMGKSMVEKELWALDKWVTWEKGVAFEV
jgi:hypothetical protein